MRTGYKVCDAMTRKPVTISSSANIQECAQLMRSEKVGSLLIKDKNGLQGIITDEDIVHMIVASNIDPSKTKVSEHMAKELVIISPEEDIFDAVNLMMNKDIKQLPVLDGSKMVGLLTMKDVLKIEPELFDLIVDKIHVKEEAEKLSANEGICQECGEYSKKLTAHKGALVCTNCMGLDLGTN